MVKIRSIFQGHFGHTIHFFFFEDKSTYGGYTKCGEKQQQSADSEPLNAIY